MARKYLWDEIPWQTMIPVEDRPRVVACSRHGWLMTAALNPQIGRAHV